jgi:hypothetical protein
LYDEIIKVRCLSGAHYLVSLLITKWKDSKLLGYSFRLRPEVP